MPFIITSSNADYSGMPSWFMGNIKYDIFMVAVKCHLCYST
jgi:hypothetical protein